LIEVVIVGPLLEIDVHAKIVTFRDSYRLFPTGPEKISVIPEIMSKGRDVIN